MINLIYTSVYFPDHHVSNVRHEHGKRIWFDVSEVPAGEMIVSAELRIYQMINTTADPWLEFTVSIYQVLEDRELKLVDSVNTTAGSEGWMLFNVTGPLESWVAIPHSNKGLYLSVQPRDKPSKTFAVGNLQLTFIFNLLSYLSYSVSVKNYLNPTQFYSHFQKIGHVSISITHILFDISDLDMI